jgi:signal transduction histidine kinase
MMNDLENNENLKQIFLLKNIITDDENERLEISHSLNENIAQMLAAVQLHIKMAKRKTNEDGIGYIEEAETILKDAIFEVKTLASNVSPFLLKNIGFTYLIEELVLLIEDHHEIKCKVGLDNEVVKGVSISTQNILYQIIQLQTINILKCKTVESVSINISKKNEKINLQITDDGIRTIQNLERINETFTKLQERVNAFDGKFIIEHQNGCLLEVIL